MEKVKKKRRHPIRNLPLKWSFMLYVLLCAVVAISLSLSLAAVFSSLQSDIYYSFQEDFLNSRGLTEDVFENEELLADDVILVYRAIDSLLMSSDDHDLYEFYGAMSLLSIPLVSLLCILLTGIIFYNRKLKKPLRLIDASSARIAGGDLDFSIQYENHNEMGRLVKSFEIMRAALQENQREMWRMMAQRKQLNAAFAHDLRTPLTVLKGYAEYLKAYVPQKRLPEEKLLSTIDLMAAYVTRLEGYTTSMSSVQKLEEMSPSPQAISFDALCKRLHSAADMLRGVYHLRFACDGQGSLSVDPNIITQVLENLVANAARYAATEISVDLRRDGDIVSLAVSDDGPGFPAKVLSKGIAPYNHRDEDHMATDHYGLGLYICSVLCGRHGGTLYLPPAEGISSVTATFHILVN